MAAQESYQTSESEESDVEDKEVETEGAASYDSDEFADKKNFSLDSHERDKCLCELHCSKKNSLREGCLTSTSLWSRKSSTACSVYKLFKVKRWLLTDVSLVFDPWKRDHEEITVELSNLLWPEMEDAQDSDAGTLKIKSRSVDGMLSRIGQSAFDSLRQIDELLQEIDGLESYDLTTLSGLHQRGKRILPYRNQAPFFDFIYGMTRAMEALKKGHKTGELLFQNVFQQLFNCVASCISQDLMMRCSMTMDGAELDELDLLASVHDDYQQTIVISSQPDLFLYERTMSDNYKKVIAVVEVKGKDGDYIIHSDEEDEYRPSSLGIIDEESEEELPLVEEMVKRKHSHMKRMKRRTRRYTRKFLPQLVGEMLCCPKAFDCAMSECASLGVAVVGFDVYFVTLATSINCGGIQRMLLDPENYLNVCMTRAFNVCNRRDRRVIFKVLAAMCYFVEPLAFPLKRRTETSGLDKLKI